MDSGKSGFGELRGDVEMARLPGGGWDFLLRQWVPCTPSPGPGQPWAQREGCDLGSQLSRTGASRSAPRLRLSLDPCQAAGVASRLWVPGCTSPLSAVTEKTHDFVRYREKLLREERGHLGYLGVFAVSPGLCCPDFQKV